MFYVCGDNSDFLSPFLLGFSSLQFISLGIGALGLLDDSLNELGLGFHLNKDNELRFVRNPRGEGNYAYWRSREREMSFLELMRLTSVDASSLMISVELGFFMIFPSEGATTFSSFSRP